jgi:hypothetical protein
MSENNVSVSYKGEDVTPEVLREAGKELGMAAEEVARILVEAQVVKGVIQLVILFLISISSLVVLYVSYRRAKTWELDEDDPPEIVVGLMITLVYFLIVFLTSVHLQDIILRIVTPEYMAIKEAIEMISGAT